MRILHLDTGSQMRGGQWQVLFLLRGLRQRGHQQVLLAPAGSPLFHRAVEEEFDARPARLSTLLGCRREFDLVHAHDARAHTLAATAGVRNLIVARRVAFPIRTGFLSRWKYGRAARFLAVSRFVRDRMMEAGIDETRIRVVYDGVPLVEPSAPGDRIVAPASSDPQKGSALARDAARLADVEVRFSEDLPRDLPGARLFLYLTHEEGLGSAVLLAMSAGVPVLASATGGIPEIVQDGVTGLLTGNQATAVAVRLARLLESPGLCGRLAEAARQQVLERFTLDHMVEGTLRAYGEPAA